MGSTEVCDRRSVGIYRKQPVREALTVVFDCVRVHTRDRVFRDVDEVIIGCLKSLEKGSNRVTTGRRIGQCGGAKGAPYSLRKVG